MFRKSDLELLEESLFDGDYRIDKSLSRQDELELNLGKDAWLWNDFNYPQTTQSFPSIANSPHTLFAQDKLSKSVELNNHAQPKITPKEKTQLHANNDKDLDKQHNYNLRHANNKYIPR